jgi:hypothetical protein
MIDPSLALTDEGMALFEDEEIARGLAVSNAFYEALANEDRRQDFEVFGVVPDVNQMRRLRALLEPSWIEKFSTEDLGELPDGAAEIRARLLDDGEPLAQIAAEQWVFIVSRSWLLDRGRRFVNRVARAGAELIEWSAEKMQWLADMTQTTAKKTAELLKAKGDPAVLIVVAVGGPAIAAFLGAHGAPVDEHTLHSVAEGLAAFIEIDP